MLTVKTKSNQQEACSQTWIFPYIVIRML